MAVFQVVEISELIMLGTHYGKVELTEYQQLWVNAFEIEKQVIRKALGEQVVEIEHVGSTSIPGLAAKPTIDILAGLDSLEAHAFYDESLLRNGYQFRSNHPVPGRLHYAKIEGDLRLYNLSLCVYGQTFWRKHIAFRDYLRTHPEAVKAYQELKYLLSERYPDDTVRYTEGKSGYIEKILVSIRG